MEKVFLIVSGYSCLVIRNRTQSDCTGIFLPCNKTQGTKWWDCNKTLGTQWRYFCIVTGRKAV